MPSALLSCQPAADAPASSPALAASNSEVGDSKIDDPSAGSASSACPSSSVLIRNASSDPAQSPPPIAFPYAEAQAIAGGPLDCVVEIVQHCDADPESTNLKQAAQVLSMSLSSFDDDKYARLLAAEHGSLLSLKPTAKVLSAACSPRDLLLLAESDDELLDYSVSVSSGDIGSSIKSDEASHSSEPITAGLSVASSSNSNSNSNTSMIAVPSAAASSSSSSTSVSAPAPGALDDRQPAQQYASLMQSFAEFDRKLSVRGNGVLTRAGPHHDQEAPAAVRQPESPRSELQLQRDPRDMEYALEEEQEQPRPSSAPATLRYPLPQPNGNYDEQKAAPVTAAATRGDWRVRFAQDLELSQQVGSEWGALEDVVNAQLQLQPDAELVLEQEQQQATGLLDLHAARELARPHLQNIVERQRAGESASSYATRMALGKRKAIPGRESPDLPPPPPPAPVLVTCGICMEDVDKVLTVVYGEQYSAGGSSGASFFGRSKAFKCQHAFCRSCVKAYLEHEISDGQVMRLRCPGRDDKGAPCPCVAPSQWVRILVGRANYEKYERFLQLKRDDSYRSCPNNACMHVQQRGARSAAGGADGSDSMQCEKCGTVYCFQHDLAHANDAGGCAAYRKRLSAESAESVATIDNTTVRCPWPTCRVAVSKSSGCNHISCQCGTEFCYLCGGFYFGGLHFAECNLLGCPGMKSDELPANSRNTWPRAILKLFIGLPLMLVLFTVALALFLAAEAVYLVWLFGLAPLWIVWGLALCGYQRGRSMDSHAYNNFRKWETRLKFCVGWGIFIIGAILD